MKKAVTLLSSLLLLGCRQNSKVDGMVASLQERVSQLERASIPDIPTNLTSRLDDLESMQKVQTEVISNFMSHSDSVDFSQPQWTRLDPLSRSYQFVPAGTLMIPVALSGLETYLDGYQVHVKIGDPYSAGLNDLVISLRWGQGTNNIREEQARTPLRPGSWTSFALPIAPASADDLRTLDIAVSFHAITLNEPLKNP